MTSIEEQDVQAAIQQVVAFEELQFGKSDQQTIDALDVQREGLGLTPDAWSLILTFVRDHFRLEPAAQASRFTDQEEVDAFIAMASSLTMAVALLARQFADERVS
jgi:hypothetical protein